MAFEIEQEKKKIDFMPILIGLFVVVFVGAAVYYMFFSPTLLITSIVDSSESQLEKSATELNRVRSASSPQSILNNQTFKELRAQVAPLSTSSSGRSNPFQSF